MTAGGTVGRSDGRTAKIAVIAGDGIGPEVIEAAIPILDRAAAKHGFALRWERLPYSADHYLRTKETLPDAAFQHLRDDVDAIFLGALGDPRVPGNEHARDILLGLRFKLDLFRSEERRVGKECRSRWTPEHEKKKKAGNTNAVNTVY